MFWYGIDISEKFVWENAIFQCKKWYFRRRARRSQDMQRGVGRRRKTVRMRAVSCCCK
jgi:hypothetical protein